MVEELMKIFENSKLKENGDGPEYMFAKTLIFNEGWLLRAILEKLLKLKTKSSRFPFLPFPDGVKVYSEAQLYTPFKKRKRDDEGGETNTHVDGIVGNFSFKSNSKSGVKLDDDFKYLAVFEAKMYSPLREKITHINDYSQVSRTIACMINSVLKTNTNKEKYDDKKMYYIVLYPENNTKIKPEKYTNEFVGEQIEKRIKEYKNVDKNFKKFDKLWKDILYNINIKFIKWEEILKEINNKHINKFYRICKK